MNEGFYVSTDPRSVDMDEVHSFLSGQSRWARGIQRDVVERAIANSLNFTLLDGTNRQRGFARVVTDRATYAWLCDVYVDGDLRGRGLSRLLLDAVHSHRELQNLRRWTLATHRSARLYEKYGWQAVQAPGGFMEIFDPGVYARNT
jgi:GNAT superfamily N-acetyltransferase